MPKTQETRGASLRGVALLAGAGFCLSRGPAALRGSSGPSAFIAAAPAAEGLAKAALLSGTRPSAVPARLVGAAAAGGGPSATWGLAAAAGSLAAAALLRAGRRAASVVSLRAVPQKVPVVDLEGKQIGEEVMNFKTLSKQTANYVVHQTITIWNYMNVRNFSAYVLRRADMKKGVKPWKQKGTGRARHGSRASPLFGKSATNQAPHGLDNKRNLKIVRTTHVLSISTVLQSKWKKMKIVVGLEDWSEPRQQELMDSISAWTGLDAGRRSTMIITRSGFGVMDKNNGKPTAESYDSPLYMSGRLIPKLEFRRPRDIDPDSDGLFQCLKARNIIISREAFFDLKAKYGLRGGWAFKDPRMILVEQLQKLVKEFPTDRALEIEKARELPKTIEERENWAKARRAELALGEAA